MKFYAKCLCVTATLSLVALAVAAFASATGRPVTSHEWAGAPPAAELSSLIHSQWMQHPPCDEAWYREEYRTGLEGDIFLPPGDPGGGPAQSATVKKLSVGQARWGRDESGRRFYFWPVAVTLRTKYRWQEPAPSRYRPDVVLTIRDCDVECYASIKEGRWTVTFEMPVDDTPDLKFW